MPRCETIKRRHRRVCVGDLDSEIIIENRSITEPVFSSPDFTESFTSPTTIWAMIETVNGKTFFDGVNTESVITHHIYINYDASVTAESWVRIGSNRLDILHVENLDGRSEFMRLVCTDRGTKEASRA